MHILFLVLFVTPLWAFSSEDDYDYVRRRLKEYEALVNPYAKLKNVNEESSQLTETTITYKISNETVPEANQRSSLADAMFEDDIMLTRGQVDALVDSVQDRQKRHAIVPNEDNALWNQTIHYRFASNFSSYNKEYVRAAVAQYTDLTCLRFFEIPQDSVGVFPKVLEFTNTVNCWSSYGMTNESVQDISLGSECETTGYALHEIGHALGLAHTQMRHDRDNYIIIHEENILANWTEQFDKLNKSEADTMGIPYEYGSVMHYDQYSPDTPSISVEARDKLHQFTMGSQLLSFYDVLYVNKLYGCLDNCASSSTVCTNGGYPNPTNCAICICPRGYGGRLCNEMPEDGTEINLKSGETSCQSGNMEGVNITGLEDTEFDMKYFWIKAPEYKKIKISYQFVSSEDWFSCYGGCTVYGMEVKAEKDQKSTGYRFCCENGTTVISNSSFVPIIIYHRKDLPVEYSFCVEAVEEDFLQTTQPISVPTTTTAWQPTARITVGQPNTSTTNGLFPTPHTIRVNTWPSVKTRQPMQHETTTTAWQPTVPPTVQQPTMPTQNFED